MLVSGCTDAIWSAAGYKPAQEVCCDSLKVILDAAASALQVPAVPPQENPKESNVIICLDFKLCDKTSNAMAGCDEFLHNSAPQEELYWEQSSWSVIIMKRAYMFPSCKKPVLFKALLLGISLVLPTWVFIYLLVCCTSAAEWGSGIPCNLQLWVNYLHTSMKNLCPSLLPASSPGANLPSSHLFNHEPVPILDGLGKIIYRLLYWIELSAIDCDAEGVGDVSCLGLR